ncbi:MAG TPA: topology modulation protein [Patescibacteria group bacterium]|nr:topology modulation protein [Patescibacteria group bacterium]
MKRVAVVGCPGAGKTTFSIKLAKKTDLPLIHLDYHYHQKEFNYYKNKDEWQIKVQDLVKKNKWIIDGNFQSTFDIRFPRSDTIIFLDYPRRIYFYGIFQRWRKAKIKPRFDMPKGWKEKIDLNFLKLVWKFDQSDRLDLLKELEKNKNKQIIIFKSRKEANKYLTEVEI